jgi:hypothetical protein
MADAREPDTRSEPSKAVSPGDVPAERPAALSRLDVLVGEWETEASFAAGFFGPGSPPVTGRGRTTFHWLEGEFFLIQRATAEDPAAPSAIMIIGTGETPETLEQHYYDSRGVARVYQMSLNEGVWKIWREAPGFWQRYAGVFSADGRTIKGAWEKSADGSEWKHDFDLNYIKVDSGVG